MFLTRLNWAWRLLFTGLGFVVFGAGGGLFTCAVFPWLLLAPKATRANKARWCIHQSFRVFLGFLQWTGVMRLTVKGQHLLVKQNGVLILANHPTLIDVVALIALIPNASCVVKQSLWKNPFLGGVVRMADYISNSEPEQVVAQCAQDLQRGRPLIIFPEGTRSVPNQGLIFQRGASYVLLKSVCDMQPVLIQCDPSTLSKGQPWYKIPHCRFHLRLTVLPVRSVQDWVVPFESTPVQARKLTHQLEIFFMDQLNNDE